MGRRVCNLAVRARIWKAVFPNPGKQKSGLSLVPALIPTTPAGYVARKPDGFSRRAASRRAVNAASKARAGSFLPITLSRRNINSMASKESPPFSKKSASGPKSARRRTSRMIPRTRDSVELSSASPRTGVESCFASSNAAKSSFPLGLSGSS